MNLKCIFSTLVLVFGLASSTVYGQETSIAVAANFSAPMQKLVRAFQDLSGYRVKISTGASGKFYSQIHNGALYDVLLSADQETPERIENEKLGVEHTRFTYATGLLVLWSTREGFIDSKGEVLQNASFNHIAIADPKLAPYGLAAAQALHALGLSEKLKSKLVQGENIGQTFQFVATANAELGFIALSQVFLDGKLKEGSAWIVSPDLYRPLHQDAILLDAGKDNQAAKAFLAFLKTDVAKRIIQSFGYQL